jgi:hypothetical protein
MHVRVGHGARYVSARPKSTNIASHIGLDRSYTLTLPSELGLGKGNDSRSYGSMTVTRDVRT